MTVLPALFILSYKCMAQLETEANPIICARTSIRQDVVWPNFLGFFGKATHFIELS